MAERWIDCVGYEPFYEVSDLGNVRSKRRNRMLKKTINKEGYVQYLFSVNARKKNIMGHQLVTTAFIGPCPSGHIPLHNNGVRHYNRLTNLRYGTFKDNTADAIQHGTLCVGVRNHLSKLTEQEVLTIRSMSGTNVQIAKLFNVTKGNVSQIRNRVTWKHI
jgi:hypothetical protein